MHLYIVAGVTILSFNKIEEWYVECVQHLIFFRHQFLRSESVMEISKFALLFYSFIFLVAKLQLLVPFVFQVTSKLGFFSAKNNSAPSTISSDVH